MAATNHTSNIQLNQWVRTDPFSMDDFNEDNAKIDAAIADAAASLDELTSALDSHQADGTGHITAAERSAWNNKQSKITGAASTILSNGLSGGKVLVSTDAGKVGASSVSAAELLSLAGISGSINDQLSAKLRVETGTYTGTGATGAGSPNTLSFGLKPMLVLIYHKYPANPSNSSAADRLFLAFRGMDRALCRNMLNLLTETADPFSDSYYYTSWRCALTWGNNSLSWYSSMPSNTDNYQFNVNSYQYKYIAIGC